MRILLLLCLTSSALVVGHSITAQENAANPSESWPLEGFDKQFEHETGIRFDFEGLCTPLLFSEPKFPISCRYGLIDVSISRVEANGIRVLPTLLEGSSTESWVGSELASEWRLPAQLFDWGFVPIKLWQAIGDRSVAICGSQSPLELIATSDPPILMAATCFLGFPTKNDSEMIVRVRFETVQEVASVFAGSGANDSPFLSSVSYFVYNTYSLSGF